jgi:hypothetical protein
VRDVHPAHECDLVVDRDDLLVLRSTDRVARIEPEMHAPMRAPTELHQRQQLAVERIEHREVPFEHARVEPTVPRHERVEHRSQLVRQSEGIVRLDHPRAAVDVPTDDLDRPLGRCERLGDRSVVVLAVDEECHARGRLDAPAVVTRSCDS